jgi:DNA-binding Lrp family transcriptional regulator
MDEKQIKIIRVLQGGLPLSAEPFKEAASRAGVTEDELLDQVRQWKVDGTIRRLGAILKHQKAGYSANAMGVWNVSDEQVESFAEIATASSAVSHCYQRPRFGGFRFNIYTMIHGRSRDECENTARLISEQTGISDYDLLYTTAEFKKSSPVYFAGDQENQ